MDAIDLRLIDLLRENARSRTPNWPARSGSPRPPCTSGSASWRRPATIRGYRAEVDHEAIGLGVTALIGIVEDSGADTDDVLAALRAMPEVESCYFMAGVESYQLIVRVGTIAELEQLIVRINRTAGVASTRTAIALSTKWENRPQPGLG